MSTSHMNTSNNKSTSQVKKLYTYLLILLCVGIANKLAAQNSYPVRATVQLMPPYSVYLPDYTTPTMDRMALNLYLADLTEPELQVKLRFRIEGMTNGIVLETKPSYMPQPIYLQGGLSLRLTGTEIAAYFEPRNLQFTGLTERQFVQKGGALPEGVYTFCIEVLAYHRNEKVSNKTCATAWLLLNDPPILNLPADHVKLRAQDPQNIVFNWTPRHTGSPNSAFSTEYEFSLVEIWPEGRNANDAILSQPPIYQTTTQSTSIVYGPAETPLVPGRRYAWRVQAKSKVGVEEMNLFKNKGYSAVHSFQWGDECLAPTGVAVEPYGTTRLKVTWETMPNQTKFLVKYRPADAPDSIKEQNIWYTEETFIDEHVIGSLEENTRYEVQVLSLCGSINGLAGEVLTGKTEINRYGEFACSASPDDFNLDNTSPLKELKEGDFIFSGDLEVKVDSVSGSNGKFTGKGTAGIPFLNMIKVRVKFNDVAVNTDYRVYEGNIVTIWNPNSKSVYDVPEKKDLEETETGTGNEGEDKGEGKNEGEEIDNSGIIANADTIQINSPIDTTFTGEDGKVYIITTAGDTVQTSAGVAVVQPDGSTVVVGGNTGAGTGAGTGTTEGGTGSSGVAENYPTNISFDGEVLTAGPLKLSIGILPEPTTTNGEDGFCFYKDVPASFILKLKGQFEIEKEISIENAKISFKKSCSENVFKEVGISWASEEGIALGKIKYFSAKAKSLSLMVNDEGKLSGSIGLQAFLIEDVKVKKIVKLEKGVNGSFSFAFSNTNTFAGAFDFAGIKDLNLKIYKDKDVIAYLNNGALNSAGEFTGLFRLKSGEVKYKSRQFDVKVTKFETNVKFSLTEGISFIDGTAKFRVHDIKGVKGKMDIILAMNETGFTSTLESSELSAFGMKLSDLEVTAAINEDLDIEEIRGSLKAKHDQFDVKVKVEEFLIKENKLASFSAKGKVKYEDLTVGVEKSVYDGEKQLLTLDAFAEIEQKGIKVAAQISEFTIDSVGNIAFGTYEVNTSANLKFGPIALKLESDLKEESGGSGSYQKFSAEASVYLTIKDKKKYEKEVQLSSAKVSFEKDKTRNRFKNISISINDANIPLGEVYGLSSSIKSLKIGIEAEDEFITGDGTGRAKINASSEMVLGVELTEDKELNKLVKLKKGVNGQMKFTFEAGEELVGSFDFQGVKNINLIAYKGGKEIAKLSKGAIDKNGVLTGKLSGLEGTTYISKEFNVKLNKLQFDVELDLTEGLSSFALKAGEGKLTVSDIKNVQGKVGVIIKMSETGFTSTIESAELSAFGMKLSDLNIVATINEELDIEEVKGTLKAKHEQFDAKIDVSDFLIKENKLASFTASGKVIYDNLQVAITKSEYDGETKLLKFDAFVETEANGLKIAAQLSEFTIDQAGNIILGDYNVNASGNLNFGPLAVTLKSELKEEKNGGAFNSYSEFSADASLYLKVKDRKKYEKDVLVANAKVYFEKHKRKNQYRNITVSIDGTNIPLGEIYGLSSSIKSLKMGIETEDDYLVGDGTGNAKISKGSELVIGVELKEDKELNNLIKLKKGVNGQIRFGFESAGELVGSFDFQGVKNINLIAYKGGKEIAKLSNGAINNIGMLSGRLTGLQGTKYTSNAFTVQVDKLQFDVEMNLTEGFSSFAVLAGDGELTVSNIKGVKGKIKVGLEYGIDGNFNSQILAEQSEIEAFGMQVQNLNVSSTFDKNLDIQKIEGQLAVKHPQFNTTLSVTQFKVNKGVLEVFNLEGSVDYKGFALNIDRGNYSNYKLVLDGKVAINAAGTAAWLAVKEFSIDSSGTVVIKQVSGELNKTPVLVRFTSSFEQSRFTGTFTGELATVGLSGAIDIGKADNYHFAYLQLTGKTDVPLGPTGLKLTRMGGQLGYNYQLSAQRSEAAIGTPTRGIYLIGLTLGVADVANMCEVVGNPIIQFGNNTFKMTLNGKLNVPRTNPVLKGDLIANFTMPDNILDGNLTTRIQVPSNSGKVFDGEMGVDFKVANNAWSINSTNITASLFHQVSFTGSMRLSGNMATASAFKGRLSGRASYDFSEAYTFEKYGARLYANLDAGFNFNGLVLIDQQGLEGEVSLNLYARGAVGVEIGVYSGEMALNKSCSGKISYYNQKGKVEASTELKFDLLFYEKVVPFNIIHEF